MKMSDDQIVQELRKINGALQKNGNGKSGYVKIVLQLLVLAIAVAAVIWANKTDIAVLTVKADTNTEQIKTNRAELKQDLKDLKKDLQESINKIDK